MIDSESGQAERIVTIPTQYQGHSYPGILAFGPVYWLWQRLCCPRGWHLWDEVLGCLGHGLSCDACDVYFGWGNGADDYLKITDYHDAVTGRYVEASK